MQGIAMARDSGVDTQNATGKRVYSAPKLTVFGDVVTLTAAGSGKYNKESSSPSSWVYDCEGVTPSDPKWNQKACYNWYP